MLKSLFSNNFFKLFVYFIFIFSGLLKWLPIGIDVTLITLALCILIIFHELRVITKINKEFKIIIFSILALIFLFLVSNFYTISAYYSEKKSIAMLLNLFAMLYPIIIFKENFINELKKLMYVVGVIMSTILMYLYVNNRFIIFFDSAQFVENVPTYLSIGIVLSACFLTSFLDSPKLLVLLYRGLLLFLIINLGGRGPLLNLIIALVIFYILNFKRLKINLKFFMTFIFLIFIVIFNLENIINFIVENVNIDRFNLVKSISDDQSVIYRIEALKKSIESFTNHPFFGLGIGSCGLVISGQDVVEFPHNLFVESLVELGLIGGVLYLLIYLKAFISNVKIVKGNKELSVMFVLCFLFFLEDSKSGSFDSWRISLMWLLLYLVSINFYKFRNV